MSISDMANQLPKMQWLKWFFLILILLLNTKLASAEVQSKYAVNDVAVNASGKSPTQARINAIASGQRSAFIILLNRLEVDENFANSLKDEVIADMVASQQIIDEKIAGNNYSATLNLAFSESFVKHYLKNKIAVDETIKPASYLVVPIKIVKNQSLIWEENNDWKSAWKSIIQNNKASSIQLIKGDSADVSSLNSNTINDNNFAHLSAILNKYKVDSLVLAYFEFDAIENKVNIDLKTVFKSKASQVRLEFVNINQLPMMDLMDKVAQKTLNYLISNKSDSKSPNSSTASIVNIDVLISDLGDWMTVKNKLENFNIVSDLKINSISKDLVQINSTYNNNNGDIINFFAKYNLLLQNKPEGGYFLSLINTKSIQ